MSITESKAMKHRILLTGDTHIPIDIRKLNSKNFPIGNELTKDDFVIVLGDFGLIWSIQESREEQNWTNWLNEKPFTTLFIDGNHENHPRLLSLPIEEMFGGKVGKVSDSIYHLKRGEVYTINDKTFFVMGGATSIDKLNRTNHLSWWKEEVPNTAECEYGLVNLEKVNNKVDYILTHTGPTKCIDEILRINNYGEFDLTTDKVNDPTCDYLDAIDKTAEFTKWFFGHMHINWTSEDNKYQCLYEDIIELEKV